MFAGNLGGDARSITPKATYSIEAEKIQDVLNKRLSFGEHYAIIKPQMFPKGELLCKTTLK